MRISDWSSDVGSSDLIRLHDRIVLLDREVDQLLPPFGGGLGHVGRDFDLVELRTQVFVVPDDRLHLHEIDQPDELGLGADRQMQHERHRAKSEEHTSELQSLMRISYAVFCLKKTKTQPQPNTRR